MIAYGWRPASHKQYFIVGWKIHISTDLVVSRQYSQILLYFVLTLMQYIAGQISNKHKDPNQIEVTIFKPQIAYMLS